jgi:8-oxo-dGTP diphosphatase
MDKFINNPVRTTIQVAVGIVANTEGQLLVAKRPDHWLGGGFWEFPGGKLEANEDSLSALKRELFEEIGIIVHSCSPLIHLTYDYPERTVILDAWKVHSFTGRATGQEGQKLCWRSPEALNHLDMLPANRAIVIATQLPDQYLITPECHHPPEFLRALKKALSNLDIKIVQLRCKNLDSKAYISLAKSALPLCHDRGVKMLLNVADIEIIGEVAADGLHLRTEQLQKMTRRPIPREKWLAGSCHNAAQIKQAEELGLDFIVFGPVQASPNKGQPLGWADFAKLVAMANIPVYALGGMSQSDLQLAKQYGAQGIAATRGLW